MTLGELIEQAMNERGWNADRLAREVSQAAVAAGYPGHTVTGQSVRGWLKRGATPEKIRLALLVDVLNLPRDQIKVDEVRDYRTGPTTEYPVSIEAERVAALEKKVAELEAALTALTAPVLPPVPARRGSPSRRG